MNSKPNKTKLSNAAGFGVVELLVVVTMIGALSSVAVINITKSNRSVNLSNSMRAFSVYLEKTRLDSVRRHGTSTITLDSTSSYTFSVDSDGDGIATTSKIMLPAGTSLIYSLPPSTDKIDPSETPITIAYDWRGHTANTVLLTLVDSTSGVVANTLSLGAAGDISMDTSVTGPVTTPIPQNETTSATTGIKVMQ